MEEKIEKKPQFCGMREPMESGYSITYVTAAGGYHPAHWHEELEILYHLNGESDIIIDKKKYHLKKKHLIVVDSGQIHSTYTHDYTSMFVCIHISKEYMEKFVPNLKMYQIVCTPEQVTDEKFEEYLAICRLMQQLTEIYIREPVARLMETEGLILQVFARLIQHFSSPQTLAVNQLDKLTAERMRNIITYVQQHFRENIHLEDVAGNMGVGKEYFCRFFKKNMGISLLQYINEVRSSHVYRDLELTDLPIAEIMERNGFSNQKIFNRTFKAIYGCTPSSVRRMKR